MREVLRHMFGLKALLYRLFTITWTLACCYFWLGKLIESIEVTLSIVIGKFLFYGIYEWIHLQKIKAAEEETNVHHRFRCEELKR